MNIVNQQLVRLANESDLVKSYLSIPHFWTNITKVTPNSVHRFLGFKDGKPMFQARFVGNRKYKGGITTNQYIRLIEDGAFEHCYKSLERKYGTKVWDDYYAYQAVKGLKEKDFAKFAFATASFNPDANPESTSVDGVVYRNTVTESWADIHDTADGIVANDSSTSFTIQLSATTSNDVFSGLYRGIFLFDTSTLGTGAIVSDADLKLYGSSKSDAMSQSLSIVSSNPASNTAVAVGDYDAFGTTKFATDITIASYSTAGYNTFTLNASGKAAVIVDGVSKFGGRLSSDVANVSPWVSGANTWAGVTTADNGSNEPTLDVTYTLPATGSGAMLLMGIGA